MNKLDRHIISSINNKESNDSITYRNDGFYATSKGVLQNFAVMVDNTLFIRIDKSAYNISKRIFKNFNELKSDYTICLGTDKISKMMISRGYDSIDFIEDIPSLFHLYNKHLMTIFNNNNINFKELIFNNVDYFDSFTEFDRLLTFDTKAFWSVIRDRYSNSYNWNMSKNDIELNSIEDVEFRESDWTYAVVDKRRSNIIDDILNQ